MDTTEKQPQEQIVISRQEYNDLLAFKDDYQYLLFQMAELKRMLFGSKSERFVAGTSDGIQLDLFAPSTGDPSTGEQPVKEVVSYEREKNRKKPVRCALPSHLRREQEVIEPENIPQGAVRIGETVTEILEYKPAEVYVRAIIRPKYVVPGSEGRGCVMVAAMPCLPLIRANAGAGVLAYICVSKFIDHLPFYRLAQIFKRDKIPLGESTIKGWFAAVCRLLEPLYETLLKEILKNSYLQADESPIAVLTADKPGATHKGYMWVLHAPMEGLVYFHYDKSRSKEVIARLLGDYSGALQTDAYDAYDQYLRREDVDLLGCAAHARRYFEHAKDNSPEKARQGLAFFRKLYRIEEQAREQGLDYLRRHDLRQVHSRPVMEEFKQWLLGQKQQVVPKTPIYKAVNYTLNIFPRLERCLDKGQYELDNNQIENKIRPMALGRRNYLFCGSHDGAKRNAMMYSLFACCKKEGVNPYQWMVDVLNIIPDYPANKLTDLLPNNWKKNKDKETL